MNEQINLDEEILSHRKDRGWVYIILVPVIVMLLTELYFKWPAGLPGNNNANDYVMVSLIVNAVILFIAVLVLFIARGFGKTTTDDYSKKRMHTMISLTLIMLLIFVSKVFILGSYFSLHAFADNFSNRIPFAIYLSGNNFHLLGNLVDAILVLIGVVQLAFIILIIRMKFLVKETFAD